MPDFRNPVFTVVISRYVADGKSKRIDNIDEINQLLHAEDIDRNVFNPELIISGQSNYMSTGYFFDKSKTDGIETVFLLNKEFPFYGVHMAEELSYGLFLAYLMHAIDFIRLGRMPWAKMINEIIQSK